jgi:hypothetical protein
VLATNIDGSPVYAGLSLVVSNDVAVEAGGAIDASGRGSHLLTREHGFAGCEELNWAGFGWQGTVANGKSIACRKCNYPCSRPAPRI